LAHIRSTVRQIPLSNDRILGYLDERLAQVERRPGDRLDEKIAPLMDCLERLAPLYREPIDLHYEQGRSTEWIADYLQTTRDAVQKRLQRARVQLAECLEHKGVLVRLGHVT